MPEKMTLCFFILGTAVKSMSDAHTCLHPSYCSAQLESVVDASRLDIFEPWCIVTTPTPFTTRKSHAAHISTTIVDITRLF